MSLVDRDLGYDAIIESLLTIQKGDPQVLVGVRSEAGQDLVTYASANEFGVHGKIPERSFLRSTVDENVDEYSDLLGDAVDELVKPGSAGFLTRILSFKTKLSRVGLKAVGDIQRKIVEIKDPPNSPRTIALKRGKANPLIDTGRMRQSITSTVVLEGERIRDLDSGL